MCCQYFSIQKNEFVWRYSAYFFPCVMYTITYSKYLYAIFVLLIQMEYRLRYITYSLVTTKLTIVLNIIWLGKLCEYLTTVQYRDQDSYIELDPLYTARKPINQSINKSIKLKFNLIIILENNISIFSYTLVLKILWDRNSWTHTIREK